MRLDCVVQTPFPTRTAVSSLRAHSRIFIGKHHMFYRGQVTSAQVLYKEVASLETQLKMLRMVRTVRSRLAQNFGGWMRLTPRLPKNH